MNNIDRFKIDKPTAICQDYPGNCPECGKEMKWVPDVIGWGDYPWDSASNTDIIRNLPSGAYKRDIILDNLKKTKPYGVFYECPKCFTVSCIHPGILGMKAIVDIFEIIQFAIDDGEREDIWK